MSTARSSLRPQGPRFDRATLFLFLGAIVAPTVDELVRSNAARGPAPEQREAEPLPSLPMTIADLNLFPERYTAHFNDTFGLRDKLLRWHSIEKLFVFGVSPTPEVVLGRDGWMFYTGEDSIDVYRGLKPFSERELAAWAEMLQSHRDHLADRGIEHLFVIAPNKESIFPEKMPARFNRIGPTRLDQLVEYLAQHSDVAILDLRPALRALHERDPEDPHVYFPLGSHWDGRGALVATREVFARLADRFPVLEPPPLDRFTCETLRGAGDTWALAMYCADLFEQHELRCSLPGAESARVVVESRPGQGARRVTEVDDPALPRAVWFHDSFGTYVQHLLEGRFSHLAAYWQSDFDTTLWEQHDPDVVIEMFVERALVAFAPREKLARASQSSRETFDASGDARLVLRVDQEPPPLEAEGATTFAARRDERGPGIEIRMRTPSDMALLPEFEIPADGKLVFYLDIESPVATTFELYYKLEGDKRYKRAHSQQVALVHGRNQVYFRLNRPGIVGRLCLRAGRTAATYVLRAFEVRGAR